MRKYVIINGPNINLLGTRQPEIYGEKNWEDIERAIRNSVRELDIKLQFFQSNHEGRIVDFIQQLDSDVNGVIINPAALSKTGYSVLEALLAIDMPFIEVHLSNIASRQGWHKYSIFSKNAIGIICGFKDVSYIIAIQAFIELDKEN